MVKLTIVTTGFPRLNARLARLTSAEAKKAIRTAARKAVRPIETAVKANAPKETGRLAKSVKVRALRRSRVRVGVRVTTSSFNNLYQGKTFYGAFQEYGWKTGRRKSGKRPASTNRRQIPPKNFIKKAANANKRQALAVYIREIRSFIRSIGK